MHFCYPWPLTFQKLVGSSWSWGLSFHKNFFKMRSPLSEIPYKKSEMQIWIGLTSTETWDLPACQVLWNSDC